MLFCFSSLIDPFALHRYAYDLMFSCLDCLVHHIPSYSVILCRYLDGDTGSPGPASEDHSTASPDLIGSSLNHNPTVSFNSLCSCRDSVHANVNTSAHVIQQSIWALRRGVEEPRFQVLQALRRRSRQNDVTRVESVSPLSAPTPVSDPTQDISQEEILTVNTVPDIDVQARSSLPQLFDWSAAAFHPWDSMGNELELGVRNVYFQLGPKGESAFARFKIEMRALQTVGTSGD